eukprot:6205322-Ditylum_brightwellii.AAC.1
MTKEDMLSTFTAVVKLEVELITTKRTSKILDAKYKKEYETLIDGTLGDFKMLLVSLEVKSGEQPAHSKAFPIPKINKETLKKEIQ